MKYRAIRYVGQCGLCGKPMKKGQLIQDTFTQEYHSSCYRKYKRRNTQAIRALNAGLRRDFEEHLKGLAKRTMRRR